MSIRPKTFIGLACIGVFGFFVVDSFGSQVSGYESFSEASESGRRAHVVGTWVKDGRFDYDRTSNVFTFEMLDQNGQRRVVQERGAAAKTHLRQPRAFAHQDRKRARADFGSAPTQTDK